jgi:ElaB/YqjD/DUF883 family membrane-anchored ribosome-binding protein
METGRAELDKLRADFADLRTEVERALGRAGAKVREARGDAVRMASDAYEYQRGRADAVADHVRERPFTSMLAAFGLGLLIAGLFVRR